MRCLSWAKYFVHHVLHHEITNECSDYPSQNSKSCSANFVTKLESITKSNNAGKQVGDEAPKMKFIFGIAHAINYSLNYLNFLLHLHKLEVIADRKYPPKPITNRVYS